MEAKPREPKMCYKCKLHGLKSLYKGGHGRLCQYRNCTCEYCTKYEVARNYENSLRAHVQDIEKYGQRPAAEVKVEIDVKYEVKTEPVEYFSSDEEETSSGRIIDPSTVSLDTSDDDIIATAGISLNQSDDLNLSDEPDYQSSQNYPNVNYTKLTEEFCPYCENIYAKPFKDHIKTCATAKQFEETEDMGNIDFLESDPSDSEVPNELYLSPTPSTSTAAEVELHAQRSPSPLHLHLQCPICLSHFPQSSPEELEAHAGSCHDFFSPPDVRTCFMCDQEFFCAVPEIEFQRHVEGHFKENDLQDPRLVGAENDKKRKLDCEALLKTSPFKLTKQFQEAHQTHSSSKKSTEVERSSKSSEHQVKGNTFEIKQSPGSSQTQANGNSSQMNQSPGSSQSQLSNRFAQMKQAPGPQARKEEFPPKHLPGPTLTQANVSQIKPEHKKSPDSHIQSLISRFEESCSQPAVHQIFVAADMVGLIIGEKAWFKNKVMEDTGVSISVEKRKSQVSGTVAVTLTGPSVNLPKAVAMIQLKLGPRVGFMLKS